MNFTVKSNICGENNNATKAVISALDAIKESGGGVLSFEKGEYHFYKDNAYHGFFAKVNNKSCENDVCFPVIDCENITIDGNGSTFVFHGLVMPFAVKNSKNINLCNFVCTAKYTSYAGMTVTQADDEGFYCTVDKSTAPYTSDSDGHLFFNLEGHTLSTADRKLSLHSIDRILIRYLFAGDCLATKKNLPAPFMNTDAEITKDGIHFTYREDTEIKCPFEIGEKMVINLEENRERDLFFIDYSKDIDIKDITVTRGGGMGFVAQCTENLSLDNVKVVKSGSDIATITADILHFVNCSGKIRVTNCEFSGSLDDACNLHGVYTVLDEICKNTVKCHFAHSSHSFFDMYKTGDNIRIINNKTLDIVCHATVESMSFTDKEGFNVEIRISSADNPALCEKGFFIENTTRIPDFEFIGNKCYEFPNIRISGSGKMLFENNEIYDCCSGIFACDLAEYWYESGRISDFTIKNNIFRNCNKLGGEKFISVCVSGFDGKNAPIIHKGIRILDNRFEEYKEYPIEYSGIEDIEISGNTFNGNTEYKK